MLNALSCCEDTFQSAYVPFSDFCADPVSVLSNPELVVRVDGKYYSWLVAAPLIMAAVVYLQVLPQKVMEKMEKNPTPKKVSNRSCQNCPSLWQCLSCTGEVETDGTPYSLEYDVYSHLCVWTLWTIPVCGLCGLYLCVWTMPYVCGLCLCVWTIPMCVDWTYVFTV